MEMTPIEFRRMFETLHNMDLDTLETAGVIAPNARGGSDWTRFNNDLTTFVLKLPADRLERLAALASNNGETGMVLGTGKERPLSIGLHTDGDPEARFESASLHQKQPA
jgi:hypothetical protein